MRRHGSSGSWNRLGARSVALFLAAMGAVVGLPSTPALAATASSPITYVHDELGRLEAVIDPAAPSNGVAKYTYDDNGNILSISRSSHTAISIIDFHGNRGEVGDKVTIYGTTFNSTVGSNEVRFTNAAGQSGSQGQLATVLTATTTTLTATVPSGSGDGPIWVKNTGTGQNILSTESFDYMGTAGSQVPTITSFTPTTGDLGTSVTITGTKFSTDKSLNVVTINDSRATVTAATSTQLTVTVPPGANTGAIEVRTIEGLARSSTDFVLPLDRKYSTVTPAQIGSNVWRVAMGGSRSITLGPSAKGVLLFQGTRKRNVALQVTGYGGGGFIDTSWLDPFDYWVLHDLISANQTFPTYKLNYDGDYAVLLRSSSSGTKTFTLTVLDQGQGLGPMSSLQPADASFSTLDPTMLDADLTAAPESSVWKPMPGQQPWTTGKQPSPFEWIRLPQAADGVTAVSGQVLSVDGFPVVGVSVSADGSTTTTDMYGRFVLGGVFPGYPTLFVDGASADHDDVRFASFEVRAWAREGKTTEMKRALYLPRLDATVTVHVPNPTTKEIILQHPTMPGLEVHFPPGSRLTGHDGQPVGEVTLMPVPLDRPPFPLPPGVGPPVYWTLQPGPIHVAGPGAWVTYPNVAAHPPGAKIDLWYYDADEGWEPFGKGTVEANARRISGKSSRIHYLDGVMAFGGLIPPGALAYCDYEPPNDPNPERPADPDGTVNCGGDPVDAGNGLFRYRQTDLFEPGPTPVALSRVYRQNDSNMYVFGRGVTIREQMGLYKETTGNSCVISLFIPGEQKVRFVSPNYPTNPALCDSDAEAAATPLVTSDRPGAFQNATLRFVDLNYQPVFYDKFWLLTRRDGTVYQFDYPSTNAGGRLLRVTDRTGNATIVDVTGTAVWKINSLVAYPSARWLKLDYSVILGGTSAVTSASDPAGRIVNYTYQSYADSGGGIRLQTITDPEQSVLPPAQQKKTTYGWNPNHTLVANPATGASPATQLQTITDPRDNVALTNVFDSQGRIDTQTLANSGVWDYEYSSTDPACSGKTKITAPGGGITCLQIAADGFIAEKTIALGTSDARTFSYARNATTKLLSTVTDSFHNRVTRYVYNNGNVSSITRLDGTPSAATYAYTYESGNSALKTTSDPLFHGTTYDHDSDGCLTKITDASGRVFDMACTSFGAPSWAQSYPNGVAQPASKIAFDYSRGDLTSITSDAGPVSDPHSVTRVSRTLTDNAGMVRVFRDPLRYDTNSDYDRLNSLVHRTDARGKPVVLEYDPNGNLTKTTDARGGITQYAYNSMNWLAQRTDQLSHLDSYTYDADGNVKTWTDRLGNIMAYCFDALDRATLAGYRALQPNPTCQSPFESTVTYDYDSGGRLVQVDDSIGPSIITRGYDDLNRLTSETSPEGTVSYGYDTVGRVNTMILTGQPIVSYSYSSNDLLQTLVRSTETISFTYDQANRLDTVTLPNGVVEDRTLNAAGDATQFAYTGGQNLGSITYSADPAGRRHAAWDSQARIALPSATSGNAVYDAADRLTTWNGGTLSYDNAGHLLQDGAQSYTWNARQQLIGSSAGNSTFTYDAFGRRRSASVSGTTRRYVYDGWNVIQEQDGTGSVVANSVFGPGLDQVLWRKTTAGPGSSYLRDALGSTIALTDGSGASTTSYTYEPYGRPSAGDLTNPFTFTSREWDSTLGLQLNRSRYYSPTTGRFVSEDPIGISGGLNLYSYARSSPTRLFDPTGLDPSLLHARIRDKGIRRFPCASNLVGALNACMSSQSGPTAGVTWLSRTGCFVNAIRAFFDCRDSFKPPPPPPGDDAPRGGPSPAPSPSPSPSPAPSPSPEPPIIVLDDPIVFDGVSSMGCITVQ